MAIAKKSYLITDEGNRTNPSVFEMLKQKQINVVDMPDLVCHALWQEYEDGGRP